MTTHQLRALAASLYDTTPDAVILYDRGGVAVSANEAAVAMVGGRLDEIVGRHFGGHISSEDPDRLELALQTAIAGAVDHFDGTVLHGSGAKTPVECYVFPAASEGQVVGVFLQAHDIAALKAAEDSLALNQQRFRSLFEYHPDGIMELKANGAISRVNVALESETGYYTEQLVGKPWVGLIAPEGRDQAAEALAAAMRGEAAEHDSQLLDRLGNRIDVQLKLVPLHSRNEIAGAYAIFKNVTAQKSAERTIETQSERIRRLYMVAAGRGESIDEQIDATLHLGLELFGFDAGYVTQFGSNRVVIRNSVGENSPIKTGAVYPKGAAFSRHLQGERSILVIPDIDTSEFREDPARATAEWRSYFAMRLAARDRALGALVFAGMKPRHDPIAQRDRDLLQLMGLFVTAALERAEHSAHIERLAFNDVLTGLPNRVLFADRITHTLATARRYDRGFAVMYLDLDRFKLINDTYGHQVGDEVLKGVAHRLRHTLRESDTVARFGGDEFVILEPVVDGPSDSADLARKLLTALQKPVVVAGIEHDVRVSIGIALYPGDATTIDGLMEAADQALYRAKREGRNRWFFANAETARALLKKKTV
jgi:diguanylate cyclase (GGDEF)-like protein/PAS domain S-box-containing protein